MENSVTIMELENIRNEAFILQLTITMCRYMNELNDMHNCTIYITESITFYSPQLNVTDTVHQLGKIIVFDNMLNSSVTLTNQT